MFDYTRLKTDLLALAILALTAFVGLSLVSFDPADPPSVGIYPARTVSLNLAGAVGATVAQTLLASFGCGAYFLLLAIVVADIRLFARDSAGDPLLKMLGAVLMLAAICIVAQGLLPITVRGSLAGGGGYVGAWGSILLDSGVSRLGSFILLTSLFTGGLLLTGEQHLVRTALSMSLLPVTMWSRLAFGSQKQTSPPQSANLVGVPMSSRLSATPPAIATPPAMPRTTPTDDPAMVPDVGVSRLMSSAPVPSNEWYSSLVEIPLPASAASAVVPMFAPLSLCDKPALCDKPGLRDRSAVNDEDGVADDCTTFTLASNRAPIRVNPPLGMKAALSTALKPVEAPVDQQPFQLPDETLLEDAEAFPYDILAAKAQIAAATLEQTFQDFGLNVKVVEIDTGPVITQFELELEKGLRLSKVTALADDLAIALRVPSVRVVAPIAGRNTVGVEVPNDVRVMVRLKELVQTCRQDFEGKGIPLFLGKDVSGKPLVVDMCKLPHLLIAGRTGTGKSVCLNTLILSMLLSRSPEQVKMLMIDPKMVELSPYSRIPHLMHPVITDMKKAEAVLGWAVDKMEERYDLLARVGVRHLDSYNQMSREKILRKLDIDPDSDEAELIPESMPYIVIIADEMADMMMTSGKDVEAHIIRLAQKSRAVGIHLVLATQKPTVDVITGLIKSNLPARISFQVASRVDSRVVLDEMGADKLLGNGDLLYMAPGTSTLRRAQGTYVSDDEVNRVIEFFADQQPEYDPELMALNVSSGSSKGGKGSHEPRERDDLYDQAVEIVIREGRGSVSLLQRALGVGYGRGARMIDWMAEDGIVGTYNGSQAREVVMTMDDWEEARDMAGSR